MHQDFIWRDLLKEHKHSKINTTHPSDATRAGSHLVPLDQDLDQPKLITQDLELFEEDAKQSKFG